MGLKKTAASVLNSAAKGLLHVRSALTSGGSASQYGDFWESFGAASSGSASGMSVTPETAMRATAVHACVGVISSTLGTIPLQIYRRLPAGGKEVATDHPLYQILHDSPNDLLTSCEWREMKQAHLCLRGNAYSRVFRNSAGEVVALEPIHPDRVSVFRSGLKATYSVQLPQGGQDVLTPEQMLHVRGLGPDGLLGYSPISLARESVGLALATERHGATFFGNGARPNGVLEIPGAMTPDQMKQFRQDWNEIHNGPANSNKLAILPQGMKYSGVSLTMEDAQFLETRKFQRSDIASIFRVPPHKIGDLEKATFSNIEQQSIEFVTDCMRPWVVRWEQRMNKTLLTPTERREYFIEFCLDGLLRGDMKSRYDAYRVGVDGGWLCPNEVRDAENLNPIEGGEQYRIPMNMEPLSALGMEPKESPSAGEPKPAKGAPSDE